MIVVLLFLIFLGRRKQKHDNPIQERIKLHILDDSSTSSSQTRTIRDGTTTTVQRSWDTYAKSKSRSDQLFRAIDTDDTQTLSKNEIQVFLDSVMPKNGYQQLQQVMVVHPRALQLINDWVDDHSLTMEEFTSWLVMTTKLSDSLGHPHGKEKKENSMKTLMQESATSKSTNKQDTSLYTWNEQTMNQHVRMMEYAVRGQVVRRAEELQRQGKEILFTNIGNPQAVGQSPISYYRQALALCDLPAENGVDHPNVLNLFPADVIQRARGIREAVGPAGTGAYSGSQGVLRFRQDVADFIAQRDGYPSSPDDIFLTNGASSAIELILTTLISSELDGVMIPIPQYPIYSALIAKLGGQQIGYELDESNHWAVVEVELQTRLDKALQEDGLQVKALAIINPGNPTGQVFSRNDLEIICKFCAKNGIVLLADEVYQRNVYMPDKPFLSAKKIALETPGCEHLQLVSFHSTSKGVIGECGRRGGYMELHSIDPYVKAQLYKLASSGLCSNVPGQIMVSLMVKPPQPGEESYTYFVQEESEIFDGLKQRSEALVEGLNKVDGIECNPVEGAMYAFPRVHIPTRAIAHAKEQDMTPDTLYALSLLEETGICVVPASGFGQKEGRIGFRTTFLPPDDKMMAAIDKFASHHKKFSETYA